MLKTTIKKKLRAVLSALLAVSFIITGGILNAFAVFGGQTGQGGGEAGSAINTTNLGQRGLEEGIAIFLTDMHPFIIDNNELFGRQTGRGKEYDNAWDTMRERGYSIHNVLGQVFRRTYISWLEPSAQASLLFVGWNNWWASDTLGIGYNFAQRAPNSTFINHSVRFRGGSQLGQYTGDNWGSDGATNPFWQQLARQGHWQGSTWRPDNPSNHPDPTIGNGNGLFKLEITEYLDAWFDPAKSTTQTPYQFIDGLFNNASALRREQAGYIWSYIAAGSGAVSEDAMRQSPRPVPPSERWGIIFATSNDLNWETTYLAENGGVLTTAIGGTLGPIPDWNSDPGNLGARQVAAYLDSLITLALVAHHYTAGDGSRIAQQYMTAAKNIFGAAGSEVTSPEDLQQTHALVIQNTRTQNWTRSGVPTITGSTDWWVTWHQAGARLPTSLNDFRELGTYKQDIAINPLLEDSSLFKEWAGPVVRGSVADGTAVYANESACRIALRLHVMQSPNATRRLTRTTNEVEVTIGGVHYGGSRNYTPTASGLGSTTETGSNIQIPTGILSNGDWGGLDTMVGPQFIIGFFGHAAEDTTIEQLRLILNHSLRVTPIEETIQPNFEERLLESPTVSYRVGTGLNRETGLAEPDLMASIRIIQNYDAYVAKYPGTRVEIRTIFARRTQLYRQCWRDLPTGPLYPRRTAPEVEAGPHGSEIVLNSRPLVLVENTNWEVIPNVRTSAGHLTVSSPTGDFVGNSGWGEIDRNNLFNLLIINQPFITYTDNKYRVFPWLNLPGAETVFEDGMQVIYTPGAVYFLTANYRADTQMRIVCTNPQCTTPSHINDYSTHTQTDEQNTSITRANTVMGAQSDAIPMTLAGMHDMDNIASARVRTFDYATGSASYWFMRSPERETLQLGITKPHLPFAVYSSSPEAFAELKNWGIASRNEPGDLTGNTGVAGNGLNLGDGRSPVDTQAGVQHRSNGSNFIAEDYEVMAGVPTTEKLYLSTQKTTL